MAMAKACLLLFLSVCVLCVLADKLNDKKRKLKSTDELFDRGMKYPADIVESVRSDIPGEPQIKIRLADADDDDDDDDAATISVDPEPEEEDSDDEDEDDDVFPPKKKKLPKSKVEDIHSFL